MLLWPSGMDTKTPLLHQDITDKIISSFFSTYNELAGFPEFVLRRAMAIAILLPGYERDYHGWPDIAGTPLAEMGLEQEAKDFATSR